MFKQASQKSVLLFFFVYILTCFANPGFMGTDEYWTGITRYVPAQEKNLHNILQADDVKSPTQLMPLLGLSHLALGLGLEAPYEQYRFVQIFIGLFSALLMAFCLLRFLPQEKHTFVFLSFTFYFASAFALTRPMYESMSAPWILMSALSLKEYLKTPQLKWIGTSVAAISIAFLLRPQTGICAFAIIGFLTWKKDWKALLVASFLGFLFFILAGFPDLYLRSGFHSSLKNILLYNVKFGTLYSQQPWFFYIPLVFFMMWGPFWISKKTRHLIKSTWDDHKIYWVYIILLVGLHSFFPQKWERFVIPVLGLMILIMADWLKYEWNQGSKKRVWLLATLNGLFWVPSTFFPAQKNLIDLSRYLDSHTEIKEILRYKKSPQWITEVFISRTDWKWTEIESLPTEPLKCDSRLVMNLTDYKNLVPKLDLEMTFETNLIEKIAYKLNPEKNLRRTPLVLLKDSRCVNFGFNL